MIVSHDHKFIFIKTNKTAGTSIEIALSRICGPNDVITSISHEDEALRSALGYRGPQNFEDINGIDFVNHMSAEKIREGVGQEIWNQHYKFCFERNPWDRLISFYYWRNKSEPRISISDFLETNIPLLLIEKGYNLYSIDGDIVVDRVCRYESLTQELEQLFLKLGISEKLELPKAKAGFRKDKRHYRNILNEAEKIKIAAIFHREIALFGYTF